MCRSEKNGSIECFLIKWDHCPVNKRGSGCSSRARVAAEQSARPAPLPASEYQDEGPLLQARLLCGSADGNNLFLVYICHR